jgi:hypothetical protein
MDPRATDLPTDKHPAGLELEQLLLDLALRDAKGCRDLTTIGLLVTPEVKKDLFRGGTSEYGFQHDGSLNSSYGL